LKLVCNVNIVYRNLKAENYQDYAQKPPQICKFMNSVRGDTLAKTGRMVDATNQLVFLLCHHQAGNY
jgi:hypothetical protein